MIMIRKNKVAVRFAEDFLIHTGYYYYDKPTVAEVARRLKISRQALKQYLLGNPIPGLYAELSVRSHRGRQLPAYRIYLSDWMAAYSYLKETYYGQE